MKQTVQSVLRPKRRNPPLAILGNPPQGAPRGRYLGKVSRIEYTHGHDGERYYHNFSPTAYMIVKSDGSVVLYHPKQDIWGLYEVS